MNDITDPSNSQSSHAAPIQKKRGRRSRADIEALIARYKASGQSVQEFAQETGVSPKSLYVWLQRERKKGLQRLVVDETTACPSSLDTISITVGRCRIDVPLSCPSTVLETVVRACSL